MCVRLWFWSPHTENAASYIAHGARCVINESISESQSGVGREVKVTILLGVHKQARMQHMYVYNVQQHAHNIQAYNMRRSSSEPRVRNAPM